MQLVNTRNFTGTFGALGSGFGANPAAATAPSRILRALAFYRRCARDAPNRDPVAANLSPPSSETAAARPTSATAPTAARNFFFDAALASWDPRARSLVSTTLNSGVASGPRAGADMITLRRSRAVVEMPAMRVVEWGSDGWRVLKSEIDSRGRRSEN